MGSPIRRLTSEEIHGNLLRERPKFEQKSIEKATRNLSSQFEDKLAKDRASVAAALAQFTRDRADYYQKVEGEVVRWR